MTWCKPGATVSSTACQHKAVSSSILNARPAAFLALGDLQYDNGELANFKTAYETSYGRFKASTRPAPGNEDYGTTGAWLLQLLRRIGRKRVEGIPLLQSRRLAHRAAEHRT